MIPDTRHDAVIVGGGHNGLVAAAYLAKAGRSVLVLERRDVLGGAVASERPWAGVDARLSRYAYLVSLLPRRIVDELGLDLRLAPRAVSSYTPRGDGGVLVRRDDPDGPGPGWRRFYAACAAVAAGVWPTLLEPLRTRAEMRARVNDDGAWEALVERPIGEWIEACLEDDVLRGVALTDALIGTFAGAHDADLRQNRCFLYHVIGGGTGDWDVPVGGMGALAGELERVARAAGAEIRTGVAATAIEPGAVCWEGESGARGLARAGHVLAGCSPRELGRLRDQAAGEPGPDGAQLKLNLLLDRLPRLRDAAVDPREAFAGTFHVSESYAQLERARDEAAQGRLPDPVPCELYCHSLADPSILGPELRDAGAQTLTCFALHTPARLFRSDHDAAKRHAVEATLRSIEGVLAEPLAPLLHRDARGEPCLEARTPLELERELGLPGGNIFHRDLAWPWVEDETLAGTWGVETDDPGILLCGAGARRGGGVSGVPGRNAAAAVLAA